MLLNVLLLNISYNVLIFYIFYKEKIKNNLSKIQMILYNVLISIFPTIYHLKYGNKYHIFFPDRNLTNNIYNNYC